MRVVVLLLVLLVARDARAHQTSLKYVDLTAVDDKTLDVSIKLAPGDVTEPMGLPADATPPLADALASTRVPPYVQGWITFVGCTAAAPRAIAVDAFVAVLYTVTCPNAREVTLDFATFFALDKRHEAVVGLAASGAKTTPVIVRASEPTVTVRAGEASLLVWIKTGMHHIYEGIDHILFVIALLLVVMVCRGGQAEPGRLHPGRGGQAEPGRLHSGRGTEWVLRGFMLTLRSTALVITAFTIAHSITLIAAALGIVTLPSSIVEAIIALSIAYTAAEDVVKPDVRWRFALTFGFGLIHGLGFASTLAGLLPPTDVVVPLLCFNLGVEIGQLSIVLVVLPVLWLVARALGAQRYRRFVLPALAAPIFAVGIWMVIDRVS